jgi:hypothetical protein
MSFGLTFLAFPDLFPARRAGEPWGERRVSLDLPGGPYAVAGLSAIQAEAARERFGDLCREDAPEAVADAAVAGTVRGLLFRAPPSDFLAVDTRGWDYAMDFEHGARAVRLAGLRLMARLDWAPDLSGALWTSEEGELFPGIFENFLRVLVAYRLLALGGVVLHSAGIATGGDPGEAAFLFLGPSEARGYAVLSDDLNALLPGLGPGDPPRVAKLPFTGDLGDRREAHPPRPLRGLLRLSKGRADALRPLSPGETLALLFACSPFVNADPHRREALLDVLSALATAGGGARELTFSLAGGFWDILSPRSP